MPSIVWLAAVSLFGISATRQDPSRSLVAGSDIKPSSPQVAVIRGADPNGPVVVVKIAPGADAFPGIAIKPSSASWDLSKFGHVETTIQNTGTEPLEIALRVDNAGNWQDNPWNTESTTIPPGQSGYVKTIFGFAYGYKRGFALDPSAVVGVVVFAKKSDKPQSFKVLALLAGGPAKEKPIVAPESQSEPPPGGMIWPISQEPAFHVSGQAEGASVDDLKLKFTVKAGSGEGIARIQPRSGRWDLSQYTDLFIHVRNSSGPPTKPRFRLVTAGGNSDWLPVPEALSTGQEAELRMPFGKLIDLNDRGESGLITSDSAIQFECAVDAGAAPQHLEIGLVRAVTQTEFIPSWLGRRPPVEGDWVQTFDDEFSGTTLNRAAWTDKGENYYDKVTHWSSSDLIVGGGYARLRYEKKTGHQNDDPKRTASRYAAGFLDSFGLRTQRYGYFECRLKVPTAPGLWPAYWMMPDRGTSVGDQGARQDTANGGMEFDVMEHLSRWGPYRYNIAMHWDGYGKDHKSIGSDRIYVRPDKQGFLTCGLLWTPGEAVYYCNGVEVLRYKNPRISNVPSTIMFTLPSGGWDNNDVDDATLPADFVLDYVRIWQRKDLQR